MQSDQLEIGSVFHSRYRVEALLGEGGMARVYLVAELGDVPALHALKLIRRSSFSTEAALAIAKERFRLEAEIQARVRSLHVVTIHRYDLAEDGTPYLLMEYLDGPPLSQGEKDGFRVAVEGCWNRGSLSTEASRTTVSVAFSMTPDGRVDKGSMKMVGHDGGSAAAAKQAYEAARRAILMCEKGGYKLPTEKYNRWKDVIIDFNASGSARVK